LSESEEFPTPFIFGMVPYCDRAGFGDGATMLAQISRKYTLGMNLTSYSIAMFSSGVADSSGASDSFRGTYSEKLPKDIQEQ
jgi:hypothetical protein